MKKTIGKLLLTIGTVIGGIAAAGSEKASRTVDLSSAEAFAGEYLFDETEGVAGGTELTAETVATLRSKGLDAVSVSTPPRDQETLGAADELEGRVLASDVALGTETQDVAVGRTVSDALLANIVASGIASVKVEGDVGPETRQATDAALVGRKLAEAIQVQEPVTLKSGRFIDAEVAEKLGTAGIAEVPVKITKEFRFDRWEHRWWFLIGVGIMAAGVALMRADKPVISEDPAGGTGLPGPAALKAMVEKLTSAVEELSGRVDSMNGEEIRGALDPLFDQYGQPFVEGREVITSTYGGAVFAQIMGPFASAERRLNRSWSAAVDGYLEESQEQLKAAVPYLREASGAFPA